MPSLRDAVASLIGSTFGSGSRKLRLAGPSERTSSSRLSKSSVENWEHSQVIVSMQPLGSCHSVAVAGNPQMCVLTAIITALGKLGPESAGTTRNPEEEGIDLRVGGMTAPSSGQPQEHVDWVARDLAVGDQIVIRIAEADQADEPRSRKAADELQEVEMFEYARSTYFRLREKYEEREGT